MPGPAEAEPIVPDSESRRRAERRECLTGVAVLAVVAVASYGWFLTRLGFHLDDWGPIWVLRHEGFAGWAARATAIRRPFWSVVFWAAHALAGADPVRHHLLAVVVRFSGALFLYAAVRRLGPAGQAGPPGRSCALAVAALFLVYPACTLVESPVGLLGYNLGLTMATAALAASVAAVRSPDGAGATRFVLLALLASVLGVGSVLCLESFVGGELARWIVIVLLVVAGDDAPGPARGRRGRLAFLLTPSVLLVGAVVVWKLAAKSSYATNDAGRLLSDLVSDPANLVRIPLAIGRDLVNLACGWFVRFPLWSTRGLGLAAAVGPLLGAVAGGLVFLGLKTGLRSGRPTPERRDPRRLALPAAVLLAIPLAVNAVLVGGISPVGGSDRHAVVVLAGLAAVTVLAATTWARSTRAAAIAISCLVALGVTTHNLEEAVYARRWAYQKSFWWQLHWRAPSLAPGTVLVAIDPDDMFSSRKDMNAIHFAYFPEAPRKRVWGTVYGEDDAAWIGDAVRFARRVRHTSAFGSLEGEADYGGSLLVAYLADAGDTLRLLDRDHLSELPPTVPISVLALAEHSHSEQVGTTEGAPLPAEIFGPEPGRGWAFALQRAELARQKGRFDEVERLGDEARRQGLSPRDPTEWLVFAEGYLRRGQNDEAKRVLEDLLGSAPDSTGGAIVRAWAEEVAAGLPAAGQARADLLRLEEALDVRGVENGEDDGSTAGDEGEVGGETDDLP